MRIEDDISSIQAIILNCKHIEEEVVIHAMIHDKLIIALLKFEKFDSIEIKNIEDFEIISTKATSKKKKTKFFLKNYRKLQLISMSLQLNQIDEEFDLRAENVKQILKNDNYHED